MSCLTSKFCCFCFLDYRTTAWTFVCHMTSWTSFLPAYYLVRILQDFKINITNNLESGQLLSGPVLRDWLSRHQPPVKYLYNIMRSKIHNFTSLFWAPTTFLQYCKNIITERGGGLFCSPVMSLSSSSKITCMLAISDCNRRERGKCKFEYFSDLCLFLNMPHRDLSIGSPIVQFAFIPNSTSERFPLSFIGGRSVQTLTKPDK